MDRRFQSPQFPRDFLQQVERARKFRTAAQAMYLRCVEEMERFRERMREVREGKVILPKRQNPKFKG